MEVTLMRVRCEAEGSGAGEYNDIEGEVISGANDLTGTISVRCDDGEVFRLNGWMWLITVLENTGGDEE
jgi:hypothetical protein